MSEINNAEIELEVINNTSVEIADVMDDYTADQARQYKEAAEAAKEAAENARNMAEAWASSDSAPAGEGTRSSKTWADVARQWAESDTEPDGVEGARSSKTWANEAAQSAVDAETAQGKAEAAQSKAETAQGKAETAQQKAETAQSKAETAQSRAEAAQQGAETARSAAEAAQGKAEAAQGKAEAAQEKAESAAGKAEVAQEKVEAAVGTAQAAAEFAQANATAAASSASDAEKAAQLAQDLVDGVEPKDFIGATISTVGVHGLVPAPAAGDQSKFLCGDGMWKEADTDIDLTSYAKTADVETKLQSYLSLAGGTMTGAISSTPVAVSDININVAQGATFTKTISAATAFTFSGAPSGKSCCFSLILTNGGANTVTWPSSVKWADDAPPELKKSGADCLTFLTADGGTTWYGVYSV